MKYFYSRDNAVENCTEGQVVWSAELTGGKRRFFNETPTKMAEIVTSVPIHHLYEIYGVKGNEVDVMHCVLDVDLKGHGATQENFDAALDIICQTRKTTYLEYFGVEPMKVRFLVLTACEAEKDVFSAHIIEKVEGYHFNNVVDMRWTVLHTKNLLEDQNNDLKQRFGFEVFKMIDLEVYNGKCL